MENFNKVWGNHYISDAEELKAKIEKGLKSNNLANFIIVSSDMADLREICAYAVNYNAACDIGPIEEKYENKRKMMIKSPKCRPYLKSISEARVVIGSPYECAVLAAGYPESVNSTETKMHYSQQWIYGNGRYVYVDNGIVTAKQNMQ